VAKEAMVRSRIARMILVICFMGISLVW